MFKSVMVEKYTKRYTVLLLKSADTLIVTLGALSRNYGKTWYKLTQPAHDVQTTLYGRCYDVITLK